MLVDGYVLNGFLFYFGVLLVALVALIEVFTFFELLGDMIKNDISMGTMIDYLWHLAPKLIYDLTPIGTLVASLICFGILTKYNEVTAFKAGGVSVHRLAAPVLVRQPGDQRPAVRLRPLLHSRSQSAAGDAAGGDQEEAGADLSGSKPAMDLRPRIAHLQLSVSGSASGDHVEGECL